MVQRAPPEVGASHFKHWVINFPQNSPITAWCSSHNSSFFVLFFAKDMVDGRNLATSCDIYIYIIIYTKSYET